MFVVLCAHSFLICIATDFIFLQDEIDTFFQGPPNVVKDAKLKSRKRSMKVTGSKSVNQVRKLLLMRGSLHGCTKNIHYCHPNDVSGTEDATIVDAEKLERVNSWFFFK